MRLNEIAVAIGAPMKPRRIGSGPQTGMTDQHDQKEGEEKLTKKIIQYCIHGGYAHDDTRRNGEEPYDQSEYCLAEIKLTSLSTYLAIGNTVWRLN